MQELSLKSGVGVISVEYGTGDSVTLEFRTCLNESTTGADASELTLAYSSLLAREYKKWAV